MEQNDVHSEGNEMERNSPDRDAISGGSSSDGSKPKSGCPQLVPVVRDNFVQEAEDEYARLLSEFGNRLSHKAVEKSRDEENTFVDFKHIRSAYRHLVTDRPRKALFEDVLNILSGVSMSVFFKIVYDLSRQTEDPGVGTLILLLVTSFVGFVALGVLLSKYQK